MNLEVENIIVQLFGIIDTKPSLAFSENKLIRILKFCYSWATEELPNVKTKADEWYHFRAKSCRALNGIEPSRDKSQLQLFYFAWGSKDWLYLKNLSVSLSLINFWACLHNTDVLFYWTVRKRYFFIAKVQKTRY